MEDSAPLLSGDLYNNICQECGLPLKIHSYEKIDMGKDSEKITMKLYCQNIDHKKIYDIDFEKYQELIKENLDKICKCVLCNKILQNTSEIPYYCYTCRKIICNDCLDNKHEKDHKKVFKYEDLKNKCLKHSEERNDICYYCMICKNNLCGNCIIEEFEHCKLHNVEEIKNIQEKIKKSNILLDITKEQDDYQKQKEILLEKLKKLDARMNFNECILKEQNECFHLFDDNNINSSIKYNNNKSSILSNLVNNRHNNENENDEVNNKDSNSINVICHDENIKCERREIINDCIILKRETKGSIILCNDLVNLELILKDLVKNKIKSKFFLVINGSSAEKVINFIKKNKYTSLFINAAIYTQNLNKYSKIKEKNPDFIQTICIDSKSLSIFIKDCFQKIKVENERFNFESLINFIEYKDCYFELHKELSKFYGEEDKNVFSIYYPIVEDFIKNENYSNEEKNDLLKCFNVFGELSNKQYETILICYLKNDNFSRILNSLLKGKDLIIYKKIGYFAGNLMHCLVEYGKMKNKGINKGAVFYKGMQLHVIDLLEFLKNRNLLIAFPYFMSMSNKKDFAQIISKRNLSEKERKKKEFYSVILKIDYLYDDSYEPCVFDLKELAQYPDEEEYILLPFTFLKIKKITIDSNNFIADIELVIIGKKEILEYKIKESHTIVFDKKQVIMDVQQ